MGILYSIQHTDASWIKEPVIFSIDLSELVALWKSDRKPALWKKTRLFFQKKRWTPLMVLYAHYFRCLFWVSILGVPNQTAEDPISIFCGLHQLYVLGEPLLHGRLLLRLVFDSAHLLIGILACFWRAGWLALEVGLTNKDEHCGYVRELFIWVQGETVHKQPTNISVVSPLSLQNWPKIQIPSGKLT